MGTWNDTEEPIAYLITVRTYGTWLPGDERGSIDRFHNKYGSPRVIPNETLRQQHAAKLKGAPVYLDAKMRPVVSDAIREVCRYRGWALYAINVRTNHFHVVVSASVLADKILNDLKAYATRRLRERGTWSFAHSPWVEKGSRRNLWNDDHLALACDYVQFGQGPDLPEFD